MDENELDILIYPFMWSFRRGDDLYYNYRVLQELVVVRKETTRYHLNKAIIVFTASIIECIIYDFFNRILHSKKGDHVPNLKSETIDHFKKWEKKCPEILRKVKFRNLIDKFRKYEILGDKSKSIYNDLEDLSSDRNRIHIQDQQGRQPREDIFSWSDEQCNRFLSLFYELCEHLSQNHDRWDSYDRIKFNSIHKLSV